MALAVDPRRPESDVADIVESLAELIEHDLVRDAEVVLAFLTLWLLDRVQANRMSREQADAVFTAIDVRLSAPGAESALSPDVQELLFESEFLHHLGEADGPDPDHLRAMAFAILQRAERPAPPR
jgi:hypothetical protein